MGSRSRAILRAVAATSIALLLLPARGAAQTAEGEPENGQSHPAVVVAVAAFDVVILRPFGVAVLAVGAAAFVPAAIVSSPGGLDAIGTAFDHFVKDPARNVFQRPLGRF